MNISKFIKLKSGYTSSSFYVKYKLLNIVLTLFSYMGHICSIFLAYFLLSRIFHESIANHVQQGAFTDWTVLLVTIAFLILFELTKRYVFNTFTKEYIQNKYNRFKTETITLFISSIIVIGFSFYFSITGANIFSSKEEAITTQENENYRVYEDKITIEYQNKIKTIEDENSKLRELNKTTIENIGSANNRRTKILNDQINNNNFLIKNNEDKIGIIVIEKEKTLNDYKNKLASENSIVKEKNDSNVLTFLIISILIESFIIIGILFNQFFSFRSYKEFSIQYDGIVTKKKIYDTLLKLIYNNGLNNPGEAVISEAKLIKLAQITANNSVKNKDIKNFFAEITHIGIIESLKNKRILKEDYDSAKFKMENTIFNNIRTL